MEAFRNARPIAGGLSTTLQAGNGSAHLLTDDDLRTEREPVKESAKRWRNWYKKITAEHLTNSGKFRKIGEIFPGEYAWPSKDIAESKAAEDAAHGLRLKGFRDLDLISTLPEGERP